MTASYECNILSHQCQRNELFYIEDALKFEFFSEIFDNYWAIEFTYGCKSYEILIFKEKVCNVGYDDDQIYTKLFHIDKHVQRVEIKFIIIENINICTIIEKLIIILNCYHVIIRIYF